MQKSKQIIDAEQEDSPQEHGEKKTPKKRGISKGVKRGPYQKKVAWDPLYECFAFGRDVSKSRPPTPEEINKKVMSDRTKSTITKDRISFVHAMAAGLIEAHQNIILVVNVRNPEFEFYTITHFGEILDHITWVVKDPSHDDDIPPGPRIFNKSCTWFNNKMAYELPSGSRSTRRRPTNNISFVYEETGSSVADAGYSSQEEEEEDEDNPSDDDGWRQSYISFPWVDIKKAAYYILSDPDYSLGNRDAVIKKVVRERKNLPLDGGGISNSAKRLLQGLLSGKLRPQKYVPNEPYTLPSTRQFNEVIRNGGVLNKVVDENNNIVEKSRRTKKVKRGEKEKDDEDTSIPFEDEDEEGEQEGSSNDEAREETPPFSEEEEDERPQKKKDKGEGSTIYRGLISNNKKKRTNTPHGISRRTLRKCIMDTKSQNARDKADASSKRKKDREGGSQQKKKRRLEGLRQADEDEGDSNTFYMGEDQGGGEGQLVQLRNTESVVDQIIDTQAQFFRSFNFDNNPNSWLLGLLSSCGHSLQPADIQVYPGQFPVQAHALLQAGYWETLQRQCVTVPTGQQANSGEGILFIEDMADDFSSTQPEAEGENPPTQEMPIDIPTTPMTDTTGDIDSNDEEGTDSSQPTQTKDIQKKKRKKSSTPTSSVEEGMSLIRSEVISVPECKKNKVRKLMPRRKGIISAVI